MNKTYCDVCKRQIAGHQYSCSDIQTSQMVTKIDLCHQCYKVLDYMSNKGAPYECGEWKQEKVNHFIPWHKYKYTCSNCGHENGYEYTPYCPRCGAYMTNFYSFGQSRWLYD